MTGVTAELLLCHVEILSSVKLIYKALTLPACILEPLTKVLLLCSNIGVNDVFKLWDTSLFRVANGQIDTHCLLAAMRP